MLSREIRDRIRQSRKVCVFTGAGVSAESGIPTFRDAGGVWEKYRPEDIVTPQAFARDPVLVWRWHAWVQEMTCSAEPNAAHKAIAELDRRSPEFLIVTQNIDNLHERSGATRMVKIHGDVMQMHCLDGDHLIQLGAPLNRDDITAEALPCCPTCGGKCRPNVVWFGELLPEEPLLAARGFSSSCDLFIIVGTSGAVSGGYGFTEMARHSGALIVEVNPDRSALSHLAHVSIRLPATEGMTALLSE